MPHGHHMMGAMHKAFSSNVRRIILFSLLDGEKYLTEIAQEVKRSPQTVDFHLNILSELGIVSSQMKHGKRYYTITEDHVRQHLKKHGEFHHDHRPPHESILEKLDELSKQVNRLEKKLDALNN